MNDVGKPVSVNDLTLVPITTTRRYADFSRYGAWWYSCKEPLAVVVRIQDRWIAFDLERGEVAVEELLQAVPQLKERLNLE